MSVLLTETEDGVTTVTLNRPEALNALSIELRTEIYETFTALRDDDATQVIVLTGAGRAFSAGLDLKELGVRGLSGGGKHTGATLMNAVTGTGKPLIGAINGFAITGGFELALMCDILIGCPKTQFADTHVRMGVVPGWGLSQRLAKLIGASRAKELSFTGNYLGAELAERWGLINRILPEDELVPHCQALAREMCSAVPETLAEVQRLINFGCDHTLAEGLVEEERASRAAEAPTADTLAERRFVVQARGRDQA
ncbi:MAG: enoyl-CoA hydratase [Gammaproteobacteria bacterium]|nr:enoyl-CoA hydratase [Gammaproteobacteria bacterium]MBS04893.1 enoyl-CoA hydratase [Gammaproteobacteria bacterium]|tara:strand:- start:873 stop:1637 length:765 start_codon:yes stop_codon:yes gene_type:complete